MNGAADPAPYNRPMRAFAWLVTLAALVTLSACGLKGDLYLPPPKPVVTAPPAPAEPADKEEEPAKPVVKPGSE